MNLIAEENMSRREEKEPRDFVRKAVERDAKRRCATRAWPGAGMSSVNLLWLLKLIEQEKEREWQRHSST